MSRASNQTGQQYLQEELGKLATQGKISADSIPLIESIINNYNHIIHSNHSTGELYTQTIVDPQQVSVTATQSNNYPMVTYESLSSSSSSLPDQHHPVFVSAPSTSDHAIEPYLQQVERELQQTEKEMHSGYNHSAQPQFSYNYGQIPNNYSATSSAASIPYTQLQSGYPSLPILEVPTSLHGPVNVAVHYHITQTPDNSVRQEQRDHRRSSADSRSHRDRDDQNYSNSSSHNSRFDHRNRNHNDRSSHRTSPDKDSRYSRYSSRDSGSEKNSTKESDKKKSSSRFSYKNSSNDDRHHHDRNHSRSRSPRHSHSYDKNKYQSSSAPTTSPNESSNSAPAKRDSQQTQPEHQTLDLSPSLSSLPIRRRRPSRFTDFDPNLTANSNSGASLTLDTSAMLPLDLINLSSSFSSDSSLSASSSASSNSNIDLNTSQSTTSSSDLPIKIPEDQIISQPMPSATPIASLTSGTSSHLNSSFSVSSSSSSNLSSSSITDPSSSAIIDINTNTSPSSSTSTNLTTENSSQQKELNLNDPSKKNKSLKKKLSWEEEDKLTSIKYITNNSETESETESTHETTNKSKKNSLKRKTKADTSEALVANSSNNTKEAKPASHQSDEKSTTKSDIKRKYKKRRSNTSEAKSKKRKLPTNPKEKEAKEEATIKASQSSKSYTLATDSDGDIYIVTGNPDKIEKAILDRMENLQQIEGGLPLLNYGFAQTFCDAGKITSKGSDAAGNTRYYVTKPTEIYKELLSIKSEDETQTKAHDFWQTILSIPMKTKGDANRIANEGHYIIAAETIITMLGLKQTNQVDLKTRSGAAFKPKTAKKTNTGAGNLFTLFPSSTATKVPQPSLAPTSSLDPNSNPTIIPPSGLGNGSGT